MNATGPCLAIIGLLASAPVSGNKLQHPIPLTFSSIAKAGTFSAHGRQHSIHVDATGAYVVMGKTALPIHVQGASAKSKPEPVDKLPGKVNFYYGQDQSQWRTGLDTFAKVAFRSVRPGVDVLYYGNDRRLEYDLEIAPGTDPHSVVMEIGEGWRAAVTKDGSLRVTDGQGAESEFAKPFSYQLDANGEKTAVESAYVLKDSRHFSFTVGTYDRSRKLVIDPVLVFGTFLGGNGEDEAAAVALDSAGNIYVTGRTTSGNFPATTGTPCRTRPSNGRCHSTGTGFDVDTWYTFVTKMNPQGTQVLYSTYIGGDVGVHFLVNGTDPYAIAVDSTGNAYVGGGTYAVNFPTLNAYQSGRKQRLNCGTNQLEAQPLDISEAFLTKLNPTGALSFSTYLGGTSHDSIQGIAHSGSDVWVAGQTMSADTSKACTFSFATAGYGPFPAGIADQGVSGLLSGENRNPAAPPAMSMENVTRGFVAKFTSSGTLTYGAFIGRPCTNNNGEPCRTTQTQSQAASSWAQKIAIDNGGNILVGGDTDRADLLPATSCPTGITIPCRRDAFVLKMTSSGTQLWAKFLGAAAQETLTGLALDPDGNTFAAGNTTIAQIQGDQAFPTTGGAYQTTHSSSQCGFLVKINSSGTTANSTLFCGNNSGAPASLTGVAVDPATKTPVITGERADLPLVNAIGTVAGAFLTRFNPDLSGLLFSSYVTAGGTARAMALDSNLNAVVVGNAQSFAGVATPGAYDTTFNGGGYDAFVNKTDLKPAPPALSTLSTSPNPAVASQAFTLTINGSGFDPATVEVLIGSTVIANASITTKTATQLLLTTTRVAGTYSITARNGSAGTASNALSLTVTGSSAAPTISSLSPNPAAAGSVTLTINGSNFDPATVQVEIGGAVLGNSSIATKTATQLVLTTTIQGGTYNIVARNGSGGAASNTVVLTVNGTISGQGSHFVPISPCRTIDTRNPGTVGILARDSSRSFTFSNCGVPANATAVAMNITLVPSGAFGYLSVWPSGQPQPVVSTMNSLDGRIKANAAIVGLGVGGAASIYVTDAAHVILDVNGYFVPVGTPGALAFYPAAPCRVIDTRNPGAGGIIPAQGTRAVSGGCLPANAQAYSLNVTVVPPAALGFLTLWPVGQSQPTVSTLNNLTGTVVANAAILRSGTSGAFNAYVTEQSHFIADLNGYFAAPGQPGALAFYVSTPCRIFDTRAANGAFGGPAMAADSSRNFAVPSSACNIPATAQAYVTNATVVPSGVFGFLTLWPAGQTRPTVSTLNAVDGALTSNAAIVPAGSGGAISVYTSNGTHLLLDISGYFAP